jgi:membrane protein
MMRRLSVRLYRAVVQFLRDGCLDHAASVAFYTLLSLGPMIYLAVLTLSRLFPSADSAGQVIERVSEFLPVEAGEALQRVVMNMRAGDGLVLLALPAMIWVATYALAALEYAINVIFGTVALRKAWHSRLKVLAFLGLGWILMGASLLYATLLPHLRAMLEQLGLPDPPGPVTAMGSAILFFVVRCLILTLVFKALPRCKVEWRAAALGALLASLLLEGAHQLFGFVLLRSPTFGLLTGVLAGTVAFLLWIHLSVAIVLLGAELAAQVNAELHGQGRPLDAR